MSQSVRIIQKAGRQLGGPVADIPAFLCPGILRVALQPRRQPTPCEHQPKPPGRPSQRRFISSITPDSPAGKAAPSWIPVLNKLPQQCAGCGAFTQTVDEKGAGYFTLTRGSVKKYLGSQTTPRLSEEEAIVKQALESAASAIEGVKLGDFSAPVKKAETPVCDRCHKLKHHETGVSIHHPSVQSIQQTVFESPYKYNHVYHVLDAADFPMSLVPGLQKLLHMTPQRSRNRRSKTGRFYHGKKTDVSFIITRSDLLAPAKGQVDSLMPYLRSVLRDALGRTNKDVRLGNIRCVSAKQAWWTKELKEEIWQRGGGGWMVGKVNVGKSQLFHNVFPKGRRDVKKVETTTALFTPVKGNGNNTPSPSKFDEVPVGFSSEQIETLAATELDNDHSAELIGARELEEEEPHNASLDTGLDAEYEDTVSNSLDTSMMLPPAPPEEDYPAMPLVSSLPGTTASPIRLSFGNGKGELIDLPGLSRGDLELHVKPEFRHSLVMKSRIRPEQQVMKPWQSILLGGFIRITPTNPDVIVMAYSFTPLKSHLTSTEKAIGTQMETRESSVENIALPGTAEKIKSAGIFPLKWDVTRQRTGPITDPKAVGIKPSRLPYRVLATDILIEGCGWVEVVAQVRNRHNERSTIVERELDPEDPEIEQADELENRDWDWPSVEVFTPEGKFVGARKPMNAWLFTQDKPTKGRLVGRPRRSMKGMKKIEKMRRRQM